MDYTFLQAVVAEIKNITTDSNSKCVYKFHQYDNKKIQVIKCGQKIDTLEISKFSNCNNNDVWKNCIKAVTEKKCHIHKDPIHSIKTEVLTVKESTKTLNVKYHGITVENLNSVKGKFDKQLCLIVSNSMLFEWVNTGWQQIKSFGSFYFYDYRDKMMYSVVRLSATSTQLHSKNGDIVVDSESKQPFIYNNNKWDVYTEFVSEVNSNVDVEPIINESNVEPVVNEFNVKPVVNESIVEPVVNEPNVDPDLILNLNVDFTGYTVNTFTDLDTVPSETNDLCLVTDIAKLYMYDGQNWSSVDYTLHIGNTENTENIQYVYNDVLNSVMYKVSDKISDVQYNNCFVFDDRSLTLYKFDNKMYTELCDFKKPVTNKINENIPSFINRLFINVTDEALNDLTESVLDTVILRQNSIISIYPSNLESDKFVSVLDDNIQISVKDLSDINIKSGWLINSEDNSLSSVQFSQDKLTNVIFTVGLRFYDSETGRYVKPTKSEFRFGLHTVEKDGMLTKWLWNTDVTVSDSSHVVFTSVANTFKQNCKIKPIVKIENDFPNPSRCLLELVYFSFASFVSSI